MKRIGIVISKMLPVVLVLCLCLNAATVMAEDVILDDQQQVIEGNEKDPADDEKDPEENKEENKEENLAEICAELSNKAYSENGKDVRSYLQELGFDADHI